MANAKDTLKQMFEEIRDERRISANTAERIGNAFLSLLNYASDSERFLRKDKEDTTNYLLKLLGGLEVGEFIDSMLAGKGTGIFPNGRIQTDRLEVRSSMTVMDLIINQIQGMEADYSFAEIGKIERVEEVDTDTYRLFIEKRTDYDFTKFAENDVCFSIVNTLMTGGTDYFTSWMRVVNVNVSENSILVVLYDGAQVPGGVNYAPVAGYNLTRRGNAVIPDTDAGEVNERSQSWLLSSREGRIMFLTNVFKPILEDYNYGVVIGKSPKTKELEPLGIADDECIVLADWVIARHFKEFDGNGRLKTNIVYRGIWDSAKAVSDEPYRYYTKTYKNPAGDTTVVELEQHTVHHLGCLWGCITDKTAKEPRWNSTDWIMLEGDPNYYLVFDIADPYYVRPGNVDFTLTARILYGNDDITETVMGLEGTSVQWTRNTGQVSADNTWSPEYADGAKNVIHVDRGDEHGVGNGFGVEYQQLTFTCVVYIPVGSELVKTENSFGIN